TASPARSPRETRPRRPTRRLSCSRPFSVSRRRAEGGRLTSLNRSAFQATVHCLTGCAIGEVVGMVVATALGWGNTASIVLSIVFAFYFVYVLTVRSMMILDIIIQRAHGL